MALRSLNVAKQSLTFSASMTELGEERSNCIFEWQTGFFFPGVRDNMNTFSMGSQIGGQVPRDVLQEEQRLRDALRSWQGNYTSAIRKFAFLLRVDGSLLRYTELWKIQGPQKAQREKDWVEVEIGVPQSWWEKGQIEEYKKHLTHAIEEGLRSMVELLQRKRQEVDADALLHDWEKIKYDFLNHSDEL